MTTKYKLLKDLPGIKAGAEFEGDFDYRLDASGYGLYNKKSSEGGPMSKLSEWFAEIPDYSFVQNGDVYRVKGAGYGWSHACCKDGKACGIINSYELYWKEMQRGKWITKYYAKHWSAKYIEPKNLVYRPDPANPKGKPLVDKLGWYKEPRKKYTIETNRYRTGDYIYRYRVCEKAADFENEPTIIGVFTTREDAERFKKMLEAE